MLSCSRFRRVCALLSLSATLACSQRVVVRADAEPGELWLAGERVGDLADAPLDVEIAPGIDDVPYEIRRKTEIVHGTIPRTELNVPWVLGSVAATLCCVPSLAASGFCLANPVMGLALVGACATVNPSLCLSVTGIAPTWWSLPLAVGGTLCGTAPLVINLWASQVPDAVDLALPAERKDAAQLNKQTKPGQILAREHTPGPEHRDGDMIQSPPTRRSEEGLLW